MSPPFYFVSGEKEDGAWWVRIWGRRDRSGIRLPKLRKKYSVCPDFRRTSSIPVLRQSRGLLSHSLESQVIRWAYCEDVIWVASARDGGAAAMAATADGQGGTMCCGPALAVARAAAAVARHNAADIIVIVVLN